MRIDLPLHVPGERLAHVADAARRAEDAGMDSVSCSELTCDPMLTLTVAAGATSRVELLTNIVVAFARSPMTLAIQGRAVQEYSEGRLILGLGSQIKPHIERRFSMPWSSPAARMAEYIRALRAIWHSWDSGDKLDFRGEFYQHTLMTPMFSPQGSQPAPRVFLAAVGERMTETAGAVADGLLMHPFSTPEYLRSVTLPALGRGRGDRAADAVEVVCAPMIVTGRDEREYAESRRQVANQVAFYGSTSAYRQVLEVHGWGELGDELNRLSKLPDKDKWSQMGALVTDDVLEQFAIVGEPDEIGAKLVGRYGGLVTRNETNTVGVPDAELALQLAHDIQQAAAAQVGATS